MHSIRTSVRLQTAARALRLSTIVFFFLALSLLNTAASSESRSEKGGGRSPISAVADGDAAWTQFVAHVNQPASEFYRLRTNLEPSVSHARRCADEAEDFLRRHPLHQKAQEARKLRALLLVNAVAEGDAEVASAMEDAVAAIRRDPEIPEFDRAVLVGTYKFGEATSRIRSIDDEIREYEVIGRQLIEEFPNQPQGYVSLLTVAGMCDDKRAKEIAKEVMETCPAKDVAMMATRLVARFALIGQNVNEVIGPELIRTLRWKRGKPGLICFWAAANEASVRWKSAMAGLGGEDLNVLTICIDQPPVSSPITQKERRMLGSDVFLSDDPQIFGLRERLVAFDTPLAYGVDDKGYIVDVRAAERPSDPDTVKSGKEEAP